MSAKSILANVHSIIGSCIVSENYDDHCSDEWITE